eukprot:6177110-Pleurochrysis_carterae.AAC.2
MARSSRSAAVGMPLPATLRHLFLYARGMKCKRETMVKTYTTTAVMCMWAYDRAYGNCSDILQLLIWMM